MCYDRLRDEDVIERRMLSILRSEAFCSLRNGLAAGVIVVAVLLFRGAPAWILSVSALGAVALGAVLHQLLMLGGVTALRVRDRVSPEA